MTSERGEPPRANLLGLAAVRRFCRLLALAEAAAGVGHRTEFSLMTVKWI